jgi:hypothetical protein
MSNTYDVLVAIPATMSAWIRGINAPNEREAGEKALDRDWLYKHSHLFELDDGNFDGWIREAYLPDPDGIEPHEPEEDSPEKEVVRVRLNRVLERYFGAEIVADFRTRCSDPAIQGFVEKVRNHSMRHGQNGLMTGMIKEDAALLADFFDDIARSL